MAVVVAAAASDVSSVVTGSAPGSLHFLAPLAGCHIRLTCLAPRRVLLRLELNHSLPLKHIISQPCSHHFSM